MNRRDLEQEIQDAFDGEPVDEAAMREALLDDPAALDAWCDYALLDAELRRHSRGRLKVPGTVPAREEVTRRVRRRRQVMVSWMSAAALVVLTASVLGMIWISQIESSARIALSPGSILHGLDAARMEMNRSLKLEQGVAELELPSGVKAVIEGPATFRLAGKNRLDLAGGHSWFHVPPGAEGFTVTAPRLEVVDLGTEFGVDLREDHPASVHVLAGKVEARATTGRRRTLMLAAGEGAELAVSGSWVRLPELRRDFRKTLPPDLPEFRLGFDHLGAGGVLAVDGDAIGVANGVAHVHGKGARLVPGVQGKALEFDGQATWVTTAWPGITGSAPRTVSLWCRLPAGRPVESAPPFALWGDPTGSWNRKFKLAPVDTDRGAVVMRISFGNYFANGTVPIADGNWHHLAVVYRGLDAAGLPRLESYVDGLPDPLLPVGDDATGISTAGMQGQNGGLSIGRYELPAAGANRYLAGAIDELRVHAGALDPEEIRKMARRP
jgi:ferric-dicitrate binding protein FerR (iron transport regulator)